MNSINFKELEIYTDITKTHSVKVDARKDLSNILYNGSTGIVAHAVALKIYNSDGTIELTDEEKALVLDTVGKYCTPAFIDCVKTQLETEAVEVPEVFQAETV